MSSNRFSALFDDGEEEASRPVRQERRHRDSGESRHTRRGPTRAREDRRPRERQERTERQERSVQRSRFASRNPFGVGGGVVVRRATPKPEPVLEVVKPSVELESAREAEVEGRKLTKRERQAANRAKKGKTFVLCSKSQKEVRKKEARVSHETGRYRGKVRRRVEYKLDETSFTALPSTLTSVPVKATHGWTRSSSSWQETADQAAVKEKEAREEDVRLREEEIKRQRELLHDRQVVAALRKRGTIRQGITRYTAGGEYSEDEYEEEGDSWRDHRGRRVVEEYSDEDDGEEEYDEDALYEDDEYNADLCVGTTAYAYSSHAKGHGKRDLSAW